VIAATFRFGFRLVFMFLMAKMFPRKKSIRNILELDRKYVSNKATQCQYPNALFAAFHMILY